MTRSTKRCYLTFQFSAIGSGCHRRILKPSLGSDLGDVLKCRKESNHCMLAAQPCIIDQNSTSHWLIVTEFDLFQSLFSSQKSKQCICHIPLTPNQPHFFNVIINFKNSPHMIIAVATTLFFQLVTHSILLRLFCSSVMQLISRD